MIVAATTVSLVALIGGLLTGPALGFIPLIVAGAGAVLAAGSAKRKKDRAAMAQIGARGEETREKARRVGAHIRKLRARSKRGDKRAQRQIAMLQRQLAQLQQQDAGVMDTGMDWPMIAGGALVVGGIGYWLMTRK